MDCVRELAQGIPRRLKVCYDVIMNFKTFFIALVLIPALDFVWLGLVASRFYLTQLGDMARVSNGSLQPVYWAAGVVYLLLALGMACLVDPLVQQADSLWRALGYGALLGLVVYGVYDFTNHATLRHWPVTLVTVDVLWGTLLCAVVSGAAYWVSH